MQAIENNYNFLKLLVENFFKSVLITMFFVFISPFTLFSQGCWTQLADMPQARYNLVSFAIGDTGYVVTGQSAGGTFRNEFFKYDPNLNSWTQLANFPGTARTGSVGFSIGSKGYVGTGRDNNGNTDLFWEYDPLLNNWTQKASFPPGNRESATGFSIGSKGYVGMGLNGTTKTDFYEYDPLTNTWTQKANFPVAIGRYAAVGFSIGSKGYVGTGYHSGFTRNNDFWEYSPATDSWLQLANVPWSSKSGCSGFFYFRPWLFRNRKSIHGFL
jgi:N-acetylneuraminic acid mutarotase